LTIKKATAMLVIDDLATSGWHIEEALTRIREFGVAAFGAVWISGTTKESRDRRQQAPH
jgi:orotate phosphoribosyltransferase